MPPYEYSVERHCVKAVTSGQKQLSVAYRDRVIHYTPVHTVGKIAPLQSILSGVGMYELVNEHRQYISVEKPESLTYDDEGLHWKILIGLPADHVYQSDTCHLLYLDPVGLIRQQQANAFQVTPVRACDDEVFTDWADTIALLVKRSLEKAWLAGLCNHDLVEICTRDESRRLVAEVAEWTGYPVELSPQACTYQHLYCCLFTDVGFSLSEYVSAGEKLEAANPSIETLKLGTAIDDGLTPAVLLLGAPV